MRLTLENMHMYCQDCGDCLLWNLGVNSAGYPQANIDGKGGLMVRRHVFLYLMGRTLGPRDRVASRCGSKLCVAPGHLIAQSYSKTLERAYATGRRMGMHELIKRRAILERQGKIKLTWEKVKEIRARLWEETDAKIAEEFGVHPKTVYSIRTGKTWRTQAPAASVFHLGAVP